MPRSSFFHFFICYSYVALCPLPLVRCPVVFARAPVFHPGAALFDGVDSLDVGFYSAPVAYDWNGDGRKDLLVGQFQSGLIRFYPNVGTDPQPRFDGFTYLTADGMIITLPYT